MYLIFTWIFWEMIQIWPVHNCLEVGNRQGWNKPPQRIQILAGHPNWEFFKKNCHAIFELVFSNVVIIVNATQKERIISQLPEHPLDFLRMFLASAEVAAFYGAGDLGGFDRL